MKKLLTYCGERIPVLDEEGLPTGEFTQPDGSPIVEGEFPLTEWDVADIAARQAGAQIVTKEQVHAERDRRFESGFYFNGVLFQSDRDSRENVAGAGTMALGAIVRGAQPGDAKWPKKLKDDFPDRDFTWTAADNSQIVMDAQTTYAFAASLGVRKEAFIKAAQALKAMEIIPADYATNDAYWPSLEP